MQPLISVCIVTYNHQAYIADCILSVLGQWGDFRLEIIVGDDASKDSTPEIIKTIADQYPGIIQLFTHSKNLGPSQNLHFTITQAQGDFIAHLDGDDFWLPGKLQAQLNFLQTHPNCPACYTNALVINDQKLPWGAFNPPCADQISLEELVIFGNFLNNSSMLYRAENRRQLLLYPEKLIDYRIHLLFAEQGSLGFLNATLTAYRLFSRTSSQISHREIFLTLYLDALLSTQGNVDPKIFKTGVQRFFQSIVVPILKHQEWGLMHKLLSITRPKYQLRNSTLLLRILPTVFYNELKDFFNKKIQKNSLRILHKNIPKSKPLLNQISNVRLKS